MSVVPFLVRDIAKAQHVQLFEIFPPSDIDREQDGPDYQASEKADGDGDPQVAEEEIGIERMVVQHIGVRDPEEGSQPVEQTVWKVGRAFSANGNIVVSLGGLMYIQG